MEIGDCFIHHSGYVRKPYTFWKMLLSFKWVFHWKLYWPVTILKRPPMSEGMREWRRTHPDKSIWWGLKNLK
jgi:hypothetical protein